MLEPATLAHPLWFDIDGNRHPVRLTAEHSPRTLALLLESLPAEVDIHCAKIAGNHIFWHAPFVAPSERVTDIMTIPAGAFVYWPERQFLELIYGELQAETASVNVLGRVEGDVAWLRALGTRVQQRQGHEVVWARLDYEGEHAKAPEPPADLPVPLLALRRARTHIWQQMPAEVEALLARRGVLLPYGPLSMAEGELRKLHELLWRLLTDWRDGRRTHVVATAAFLVEAINARVAGFCHLRETGQVLAQAADFLQSGEDAPVEQVLEELVLYCGRAAAWLDQCIPWSDLNQALLRALAARHGGCTPA